MSALTVYCQWEDERLRERTGHPPLHAEVKKLEVANTSNPWTSQG